MTRRVALPQDDCSRLISEGLIAVDDHAAIEWARSCGWDYPTKAAFLREQQQKPVELKTDQLATLQRRLSKIEKILGPGGKTLVGKIGKGLAAPVREYVTERMAGMVRDEGTWKPTKTYAKGALVSHSGSAWVAQRDIEQGIKPGAGDTGWRLAVKR